MSRLGFMIPGPPEGKRRPRVDTRRGFAHVHPHDSDIKREKLIRATVKEAMSAAGIAPFVGPVAITIECVFEVTASWSRAKQAAAIAGRWHTSKPDGDNIEKSILDGLNPEKDKQAFCLTDDATVASMTWVKRYGSPARTEVTIESLAKGGLL